MEYEENLLMNITCSECGNEIPDLDIWQGKSGGIYLPEDQIVDYICKECLQKELT